MAKDIDIIDVGGSTYEVRIEELTLAEFSDLADAQARKDEIGAAVKIIETKVSDLWHRTGWKYRGQIPFLPELFVDDEENEKDFLAKLTSLNGKLDATGIS